MRRIFVPKRDVNGEWRRLHNEEHHSLDRLPNIVRVNKSRRLRWTGRVARLKESIALIILTGTHRGRRPLERPRCRWESNITMDLKEKGNNTRNWIESAQNWDYWIILVNAALILWVPKAMELVS